MTDTITWLHWDDKRCHRQKVYEILRNKSIYGREIRLIPCADSNDFFTRIVDAKTVIDGVILDIQNGEQEPKAGFEIAKEVREITRNTKFPVIFLTQYSKDDNKLISKRLNIRADELLDKDSVYQEPRLLLETLKLSLYEKYGQIIEYGNMKYKPDRNIFYVNNQPAVLSSAEMLMLLELIKAQGQNVLEGDIREILIRHNRENIIGNLSKSITTKLKQLGSTHKCWKQADTYYLRERADNVSER